jgi:hypothetical protein
MRRLGGDFDQPPKQGEFVSGVFGFIAQDAQKILIDVLGHAPFLIQEFQGHNTNFSGPASSHGER